MRVTRRARSISTGTRLAKEFALGDRMFHSAFGGSMLNHTFLVCSCAFVWPDAPEAIVAKLDADGKMLKDGKVSPDGYVITSRSVFLHAPTDTDPARLVPPQTMPHIGDRLDAQGVGWIWYAGGYDDALAGRPDAKFQFHHQPLAYFQDLAPGTSAQKAHLQDLQNLYGITDGDAHLGDLVELYGDMLIIVTYDENGGFWDHVSPPSRDRWGPGTRIPLIAVGPTVKRGFVDHTTYDFGSILKTIEERFGLDPLTDADAFGVAVAMAAMGAAAGRGKVDDPRHRAARRAGWSRATAARLGRCRGDRRWPAEGRRFQDVHEMLRLI